MSIADDHARAQAALAAAALEVDPGRSNIILCVGTKGSGKSEAARQILDAWPHDRVVIDITGDARPDDPETLVAVAPFPASMPPRVDERGRPIPGRVTVWARIDPRSATLELDHEQALAMGLYPQRRPALVMVDEYGMMATANKIGPNVSLALMSSRHYHLTLLLCCPRPRRIPTLTIEQADKVLIFDTPNADDREVLAKNMGYPVRLFEEHYAETMRRERHSFLLFDKRQRVLVSCPPLPIATHHGPRS